VSLHGEALDDDPSDLLVVRIGRRDHAPVRARRSIAREFRGYLPNRQRVLRCDPTQLVGEPGAERAFTQ